MKLRSGLNFGVSVTLLGFSTCLDIQAFRAFSQIWRYKYITFPKINKKVLETQRASDPKSVTNIEKIAPTAAVEAVIGANVFILGFFKLIVSLPNKSDDHERILSTRRSAAD